jgi:serine O-acetyltransferase
MTHSTERSPAGELELASDPSMAISQDTRAEFLAALADERRDYAYPPQLRAAAAEFAQGMLALLFPQFAGEAGCELPDLSEEFARLEQLLRDTVGPLVGDSHAAERLATEVFDALPLIRFALLEDARATYLGDPAAESVDAVILAYPGFYATAVHRIAHPLYVAGVPLFPRMLSEFAHRATGIDIHPGATIGRAFSIDHGTGVVVGETAVLGDRVKLFQGVTLGALMVRKGLASTKRHPTIGNDVVVYANATILGGDTVVGDGSVVGGNVWLTRSVPPNSVVTYGQRAEATHVEHPLDYSI